jgi:hypothetical protein
MTRVSRMPGTGWIPLLGVTVLAQFVSGALSAYTTYVLVPSARETFRWGAAALGLAAEPVVVPLGLAVGAFGLARRTDVLTCGRRELAVLFVVSLASFYAGFWAVGVPAPTPGGAVPLPASLVAWQLFEPSPYLPWAWSVFLAPGVEGCVATLAGIGVASHSGGR